MAEILKELGPIEFSARLSSSAVILDIDHTLPILDPLAIGSKCLVAALPVIVLDDSSGPQNSANKLRFVALSVHLYQAANKHLPTDILDENGKPLLSLRVALLPYLEEYALYERFHLDEPWDSAHNRELLSLMPDWYVTDSDGNQAMETTSLRGIGGRRGMLGTNNGVKRSMVDISERHLQIIDRAHAIASTIQLLS